MKTTTTQLSEPLEGMERVEQLVIHVAEAMKTHLGSVVNGMREVLITEIPELESDDRLVKLLDTAIESNVDTILHVLRHRIKPRDFELPPGAIEHARRIAQHNVPVDSLIRAYRLGQRFLLERFFDEIHSQSDNPQINYSAIQHLILVTFAYIDRASQEIVAVYADERTQWSETRNTVRTARVREVLAGVVLDADYAEAILNYRLDQFHLGAILWMDPTGSQTNALDEIERTVSRIGRALPSQDRPLLCMCDEASAWAWFPLGPHTATFSSVQLSDLASAAQPHVRTAIGGASAGIEGFRATHQQAGLTQRLSLAVESPTRLLAYTQPGVPTAALLVSNVEHTRNLVQSVLGDLSRDDPGCERLRETVLEFLLCGSNYAAAAERLTMHKNTVRYRVARAQDERGRPFDDDRTDVEVALIACRWLGRRVLSDRHRDSSRGPALPVNNEHQRGMPT